MHRTTVAIEDRLMEQIRLRAARERRSVASVVNDVLRAGLGRASRAASAPSPAWRVFRSGGPLVDLTDRDAVWSAMEEK
ncbi:MAG: CopG family transcriptional regulator [Deltaproteobacteria bacterium]|nr:CopG family transcriptional regulator [Deltaproteobacteria bacterium]